jgi:hypothetical protein
VVSLWWLGYVLVSVRVCVVLVEERYMLDVQKRFAVWHMRVSRAAGKGYASEPRAEIAGFALCPGLGPAFDDGCCGTPYRMRAVVRQLSSIATRWNMPSATTILKALVQKSYTPVHHLRCIQPALISSSLAYILETQHALQCPLS